MRQTSQMRRGKCGYRGEGPSAVGETAENAAGFQPSYGALEKLLQKISQWLRQSVAAPLESEEELFGDCWQFKPLRSSI